MAPLAMRLLIDLQLRVWTLDGDKFIGSNCEVIHASYAFELGKR